MRLPRLKRQPQRHAFAQQVLLANDLAHMARAHAFGQGSVGGRGRRGHGGDNFAGSCRPVYGMVQSPPGAASSGIFNAAHLKGSP